MERLLNLLVSEAAVAANLSTCFVVPAVFERSRQIPRKFLQRCMNPVRSPFLREFMKPNFSD